MSYGIKILVWGDYALFSRPELKTERCSYDVMTPSAARGILESIYWHPGLCYKIDNIYVLKPIQFTNIRRNEVKSKILCKSAKAAMLGDTKPIYLATTQDIVQRAALILKDVKYVIEAHFDITEKANASDNHGKFKDIIMRRIRKGECYSQPYFGCREFSAHFRLYEEDGVFTAYPDTDRELGYMLYDLDYSDPENIQPMFFRAKLSKGVLNVADCEVVR